MRRLADADRAGGRAYSRRADRDAATVYCACETPIMDVMVDAGCRRCGLPVDFSPHEPNLTGETPDE